MKMAVTMNPMAENGSLGGMLNNFRIRLVIIFDDQALTWYSSSSVSMIDPSSINSFNIRTSLSPFEKPM